MSKRVYLSEISPWWTMERQEQALADVLPTAVVYSDHVDARSRRAHNPALLVGRAGLLRPTNAPLAGEEIHVASLAVLAWGEEDFRAVLTAIKARGAVLVSSEGIEGDPVEAWRQARRQSRLEGAALRGSAVSAEKRKARSIAAVEKIKDRWKLPSKGNPQEALLAEAGVSRNTVKAVLGCTREQYQARYQATLKRRARQEAKKP